MPSAKLASTHTTDQLSWRTTRSKGFLLVFPVGASEFADVGEHKFAHASELLALSRDKGAARTYMRSLSPSAHQMTS
ncbi:MAG: hypothetical protein KKD39_02550 [Candidatus Altiarchaeota archaeon]|nr:hypothetical protein [Candidatus Altiarchaeota archaeon]